MRRTLTAGLALALMAGCRSVEKAADSTVATAPDPVSADSVARLVVGALGRRDIARVASFAHPGKGIRFTPYTRVDPATDRVFSADELRARWASPDSILWGSFDGTGDPMRLTFRQYFDRFVYDFDFARAPRVARDSAPMGIGNSIYNLREAYPGATIVEFNSPGVDPKYGGMDWRSLWIIFERVGGEWRVIGVVHGSWTT